MPEGQKEKEDITTFDEDEYKSNLIDNEEYSETTAAMKAKKKREQLEAQAAKGPVAKMIEINLNDITTFTKTQTEQMVTVRRAGKTFQRRQKVGSNKNEQQIKHDINTAQSEYKKLNQKMDNMIDKYYDSEKISPKNKKKIDGIENQMKGVHESITSMKKEYEKITSR